MQQPSKSNAGGVGFYINKHLKTKIRSDLSSCSDEYESLWVEIVSESEHNLLCGVIYRHPKGNVDNFMNYINMALERIHHENKYCTVMGDFNLDLLKFESHQDTNNFLNTLSSFFFQPQILQPTRITEHSATLIDNIFFNSLDHFVISGNLIYDLSDHLPNFLIITKYISLPSSTKFFRRDYSALDESALLCDIQAINWDEMLESNQNPDKLFDFFCKKVSEVVDRHVPIKQLSKEEIKTKFKPWITPAIKTFIRKKNKLYKKYLKTKSVFYHTKFKLYRNKLNHLLRVSKRNYYSNYFETNGGNSRKIWKGIKNLVHIKSKSYQTPEVINDNGCELTDVKSIANAFNDYFSNVGWNLANNIPKMDKSPIDYLAPPTFHDSFFLAPVTAGEIEKEIASLNCSKAIGPFSIPVVILKLISNVVSRPLETIFNASLSTGIVPASLKLAKVIPIFKKGLQNCLNNYRPISLLSIFNKILEKLVYKRLHQYLEKKEILYYKKFFFRTTYSTTYALLSIVDKINEAIDHHDYACGIFLDLSKAFDTVNHDILIKKLEFYGVRGLVNKWFSSYLSNRRQFVSVNNISSDELTISCGVPQGSVLGPLLFLIYVNDFANCSKLLEFNLYADDSNLFYKSNTLLALQTDLNKELAEVYKWLCVNKLSLNIKK